MLTGFVMVLHALVCIILIVAILMQSGRGGGLTEGFSSAESMLGAQTNEFMVKATTILSTVFLITCLGLAILSSQRSESLMSNKVAAPITQEDVSNAVQEVQATAQEAVDQVVE